MASSGKRKTTTAKLNRERKLREKRIDKQAKKDARKLASTDPLGQPHDLLHGDDGEPIPAGEEQAPLDPAVQSGIDG
jgi:hypothetical protein